MQSLVDRVPVRILYNLQDLLHDTDYNVRQLIIMLSSISGISDRQVAV